MDSRDLSGVGWSVLFGSCLDRLPELADNSVDAVVCDPPYELGFMGKSWDSSGIAFNPAVWAECLRVLKPGGHILAFGGSRTWHRIAVAVEDAGFEIRDSIAWLYGSGFPKSLDVSKAIDKRGGRGAGLAKEIGEALKKAREKRKVSKSQADEMFCDGTTNWTWFEGRPAGQRPPTPETFARIVAEWQELKPLADIVAEAEREVIGQKTSGIANKDEGARHTIGASKAVEVDVTAPSTPEALKWQGWGTALKPAFEPVIVGRKPLVGTVAANVLEWGTGGLNIDGTRIGINGGHAGATRGTEDGNAFRKSLNGAFGKPVEGLGRWPSNVMLDEVTAGLVDQQSGVLKSGANPVRRASDGERGVYADFAGQSNVTPARGADSGGASRFFYVAKASKRDRNEGLDGLEGRVWEESRKPENVGSNTPQNWSTEPRQNFHPTVKPTDLMRQLVRLVTPPGGVVLDPFTGSGSTGKAAILEGFEFIGCELTEDYLPIIQGRIDWAVAEVARLAEAEKEKLF